MKTKAEITTQEPDDIVDTFPCPNCNQSTSHSVLSIINSKHSDGFAWFWDNYLTVKCNGCGTISFSHISKCSEEEEYDEKGSPFLIKHKKHYPEFKDTDRSNNSPFVDINRIEELKRKGPNSDFDLAKLLQMLVELNNSYKLQSYFSCIFLIRAIIDHIPPIFGLEKFTEIANNYSAGKSFKDSMKHLEESSRKIADSYLHMQMRSKESLPTIKQVEFRADLDVLIGEVIRILKK